MFIFRSFQNAPRRLRRLSPSESLRIPAPCRDDKLENW
ncbi:hypothetical protein RGUI_2700 [Rhodovulum sp. P5]|nr:hypothetical protein RGUI_2700 [Rhodovulum sp. P5]